MAEEINAGSTAAVVETDSPIKTPQIKKQRAPRRQKTAVEPVPAASEATTVRSPAADPVKPSGRGRGRKPKTIETKVTDGRGTLKDALKSTGRKKAGKPVGPAAKTSALPINEIEDLVQLEEENKRLRKTLAEKLRQENADLRKRLGLD